MKQKNKNFYVWTIKECIRNTYRFYGIQMMRMYDSLTNNFPNATSAIKKMYNNFSKSSRYEVEPLTFENPNYIYEVISNLIPINADLQFNLVTKELHKDYATLNMCFWKRFIPIKRIDLVMTILLLTEEFLLQPLSAEDVFFTGNSLLVRRDLVNFTISQDTDITYISIEVKEVMFIQYQIKC